MYSDSQTNIPFEANDINRQQPGSAVNTLSTIVNYKDAEWLQSFVLWWASVSCKNDGPTLTALLVCESEYMTQQKAIADQL